VRQLFCMIAAAGALCLGACATSAQTCSPATAERAAGEAIAADSAFAALAQTISVPEAFQRYAAADAVTFNGAEEVHGRAGVAANFADWPEGAKLEWAPVTARGSACGDMAWTWGRATYTAPDGTQSHGRYATIWKREADGQWRFGFDAALRRVEE
jgi:ketosteroid isomerase-like protein